MLYFILGGLSIGIGVMLFFGSKKAAGKSLDIQMTDLTNTKNLLENFNSLTDSFGKGSFSLYAKLRGVAYSNSPLISEYSKKECVYYKVEVEREYEELVTSKDSDGKTVKKWERKSEVLVDSEKTASDFSIKDESGMIKINHKGSNLQGEESYSNFEKGDDTGSGSSFNFAGVTVKSGPTIRTIGYTHTESIIPIGRRLFVVGDANDRSGELTISNNKDKPFIVSIRTEDEVVGKLSSSSSGKKRWSVILLIVGITLLIVGILKTIGIL